MFDVVTRGSLPTEKRLLTIFTTVREACHLQGLSDVALIRGEKIICKTKPFNPFDMSLLPGAEPAPYEQWVIRAQPASDHGARGSVRADRAGPSIPRVLRYRTFIAEDILPAVRFIERSPNKSSHHVWRKWAERRIVVAGPSQVGGSALERSSQRRCVGVRRGGRVLGGGEGSGGEGGA